MKESSVLHTKMAGHRQTLKGIKPLWQYKSHIAGCRELHLMKPKGHISLKQSENCTQLWMVHNLHILSFTNTLNNELKHNIKPTPTWNYTDVKVYNRDSFLLYSKHESVLFLYLRIFHSIIRQFNFRMKMNKFDQGNTFWIINLCWTTI